MAPTEWSPVRRRWLVWGLVAAVIVLGAVWFVRAVVIRDRARAVPTEEVVGQFRSAATTTTTTTSVVPTTTIVGTTADVSVTSAPAPDTASSETSDPVLPPTAPPATTPEPGVYRYRTTGFEEIDALGGTFHAYPDETTITVVEGACGVTLRWDALRERRESWGLCVTAEGVELQRGGLQYHEFYGQGEEEQMACDRTVVIVPVDGDSRDPTSLTCTLASESWLPVWEVLPRVTRVVDGREIDVQQVRMTILDEDEYWEQLVTDWYLALDGLPVEVVSTKRSRSPSIIGPVVYREEYTLELVSAEPLR